LFRKYSVIDREDQWAKQTKHKRKLYADESKSSNDTKITLQNISNQLELVRLIGFHQQMAEKQRNLYNKMTHDPILLNDSIMIEMDFKQKIVFGNQILLFMFLFIFIIFSKIIYFRCWSKAN
jgi:hypothetical protein